MRAQADLEQKWQQLDPIFIRGMQRSGTSVVATALGSIGLTRFGEGHLWFEVLEPFSRFRDPGYCASLKRDTFTLGQGRNLLLEKQIALAIDRFHRDNLPEEPTRWVDKSPGPPGVEAVPMLARAFPRSQFIFMVRSGVATVHSGRRLWSERRGIFRKLCRNWRRVMSTWRQVREELGDRYVEIRQEELAVDPERTAAELTEFLGLPEHREEVAEWFRSRRVNTAFPDRAPGDYGYEVDWSDEEKAFFVAACGEEMSAWGYAIPWQRGAGDAVSERAGRSDRSGNP